MSSQLYAVASVLQQEEVTPTPSTEEIDVVCGSQGPMCEVLYEGPTTSCSPR